MLGACFSMLENPDAIRSGIRKHPVSSAAAGLAGLNENWLLY